MAAAVAMFPNFETVYDAGGSAKDDVLLTVEIWQPMLIFLLPLWRIVPVGSKFSNARVW